jgi:hypothetical protein
MYRPNRVPSCLSHSTHPTEESKVDGRAVRRSLNKTGRYVRKPNKDPKSNELMEEHGVGYSSTGLVAQMREQGNTWKQGEVSVKLAQSYGYCWGVERAVRMAYEARNAFPEKRIHITNEIIHNPEVNQVSGAFYERPAAPVCWARAKTAVPSSPPAADPLAADPSRCPAPPPPKPTPPPPPLTHHPTAPPRARHQHL